jgi:PsbP-like protein
MDRSAIGTLTVIFLVVLTSVLYITGTNHYTRGPVSFNYPLEWKIMGMNVSPEGFPIGISTSEEAPAYSGATTKVWIDYDAQTKYNFDKGYLAGYKIISRGYTTIDGVNASEYVFKGKTSSDKMNRVRILQFNLQNRQKNGWWEIRCECLPEDYARLQPKFNIIVNSFHVE